MQKRYQDLEMGYNPSGISLHSLPVLLCKMASVFHLGNVACVSLHSTDSSVTAPVFIFSGFSHKPNPQSLRVPIPDLKDGNLALLRSGI